MSADGLDQVRGLMAVLMQGESTGDEDAVLLRWDRGWAALEAAVPEGAVRPRVFVEEWAEPPMAAGAWVPDLVRRAGGEPFVAPPGTSDLAVSWEEVLEFDPQLVLLAVRGQGLQLAPESWMTIEGWNRVEAAAEGRVLSVDDSLLLRPTLRLLDGATLLQALIGEAFWGWKSVHHPGIRRLDKGKRDN